MNYRRILGLAQKYKDYFEDRKNPGAAFAFPGDLDRYFLDMGFVYGGLPVPVGGEPDTTGQSDFDLDAQCLTSKRLTTSGEWIEVYINQYVIFIHIRDYKGKVLEECVVPLLDHGIRFSTYEEKNEMRRPVKREELPRLRDAVEDLLKDIFAARMLDGNMSEYAKTPFIYNMR